MALEIIKDLTFKWCAPPCSTICWQYNVSTGKKRKGEVSNGVMPLSLAAPSFGRVGCQQMTLQPTGGHLKVKSFIISSLNNKHKNFYIFINVSLNDMLIFLLQISS